MNALFSWLSEVRTAIKKHKVKLIVFAITVAVGIVLGIVLPKQTLVKQYYLTYCRTYTGRVFSSSVFSLFFRRMISSLLLFILIFPLYFTVFYLPFAFLIVFFKGFTFGVVTVILLSSFGVSGFFIWLICALPVALFLFACLCAACAAAGEFCAKKPDFSRCADMLPCVFFLLLCAVCCAILECVLVAIVFRPVSRII